MTKLLDLPKRIRLRRLEIEDAEAMASWDDPPTAVEVQRRIIVDQLLKPRALAFAVGWIDREGPPRWTHWAHFVGWGMIDRSRVGEDELRWVVAPLWRDMGIGTEIARQLSALACQHSQIAIIAPTNAASIRVAEKIGMQRSPRGPEYWWLPPL